MIRKYGVFFKDVPKCALITAVISFILYLLLFMGVCYGFTWLPNDGSFNQKFEKYFILAIAIFMILPFTLSNLLIHFIIRNSNKNPVKSSRNEDENKKNRDKKTIRRECLLLWIKLFMPTTAIFAISTIATGIYTIIEGTLYLGITILVSGVVLLIFKIHTILIVASLREYLIDKQRTDSPISSPRNSTQDGYEQDA